MKNWKNNPWLSLAYAYLKNAPQPSNWSYLWNLGLLLAFCLVIQIVTGVTLAMHYNPSVAEAFNSVEHIMRDVNNGWLIRYLHSNTASAFFFLVYLHVGRGLYYGSYKAPRTLVWIIGTIILVLMMATAFLGYVLPYNQVCSMYTYLVFPIILAVLALMHLIALHDSAGSGNPLGIKHDYYVIIQFLGVVLMILLIFVLLLVIIAHFSIVFCTDDLEASKRMLEKGIAEANEMAQQWNDELIEYEFMISEEADPENRKALQTAYEETRVNRDQAVDKSNKLSYQLSKGSDGWLHKQVEVGKRELPNDTSSSSYSSSSKRKR